jgi:hypothetical protein
MEWIANHLNYTFKAEGEKLLGLIESRLGGGQISDGKIDGKILNSRLMPEML